ncbi:MAG TPA: TIM-barrel domain-containing protein, partial [Leptolinea sp.]
ILNYNTDPDKLLIKCDSGWFLLTPYTASSIRIRFNANDQFGEREELIINVNPLKNVEFNVEQNDLCLVFSTSCIRIQIDNKTLAFTYMDTLGNILTKEPGESGKVLESIDVHISNFDEMTEFESRENVDGVRIDAHNIKKVFSRKAFHTKLAFEWSDDEAIYGLGSHEEGMFNLRGQHQYLYQQNMKAVVPVFLSTKGYGIFVNSTSLMAFHDDAFGSYIWTDVDDEIDYFFIHGPEFDQIIGELRELTGRCPMLPKWAFGYIQSKERYVDQTDLIEVVKEYRRRNLPLDCIVLDWKSWPGDYWGQKSLDPERFPTPDQMTTDLHALHTRLMVSIWPIMRPGGKDWHEMNENGYLLGNKTTYDAFNGDARNCYWEQTNYGFFSHGVDAWWCDCTEPFEADWNGAVKSEPEERMRINTDEAKKYIDPEFINSYSLLHSKGIYEGQRIITDGKRVVNLTRSAYLGQQRYSTITWSGDTSAKWDVLRNQIPAGLNFCVTGQPYWTTDIGAYFVKRKNDLWFWNGDYDQGVEDLAYRELYVRWFQFGTFLPMFRSHGTDTPREIWRFGEPGEPPYDTLVKFLDLRYRLIPYIYSLAGWVTQNHYTMMRLLAFDFRNDPLVYDIADEFMFGPAFLVNPVTSPMYYSPGSKPLIDIKKSSEVYLPKGCQWVDFWTGEKYSGGQFLRSDAPLDRIPVFVRIGSIIPMSPGNKYADENPGGKMEIHIFPGGDGSFQLYEDEGDGYNYEKGKFSKINLHWRDANRQLIIGERVGEYEGMNQTRIFSLILHNEKIENDEIDPINSNKVIEYEGKLISVKF